MGRNLICSVVVAVLLVGSAAAQPGGRHFDVGSQVLDLMFPLKVEPEPYFSKMVLRFGDTLTQFTVVVYPGSKAEVIRYRVTGRDIKELHAVFARAVLDKTITPKEITTKLSVDVSRVPVNYDAVLQAPIERLQQIRISPVLGSRAALHGYSHFEFWYDLWQESVHYSVVGPFDGEPQDELTKWMLSFRDQLDALFKAKQ